MGIRPQNLTLDREGADFTVNVTEHLGGASYVHLTSENGERVVVECKLDQTIAMGTPVGISFNPEDAMIFDAQSGTRLRR